MLSALIVHGIITDDLSVTTILPIPKGKNLNYSNSANYRGIALGSIIGKISDAYTLNRYDNMLSLRVYNLASKPDIRLQCAP